MTLTSPSQAIVDSAFDTAISAALAASNVIAPFWSNPRNARFDQKAALNVIDKEGIGNYATIADFRSEQKIIEVIQSNSLLRDHSILSEESDEIIGDDQWRWIIDPIDGTPNFRNGNPDFGICIALFNGQRPVVGLIAMPGLQQMAVVKIGASALLMDYSGNELADLTTLANRNQDSLERALVGYDLGYSGRSGQLHDIANRVIADVGYASCLASYSTGNFRLLQGMMGIYFGMSPTIMDVAPAAALIPAVGGVVTDMNGDDIDWLAPSRSYVGAVNPRIHDEFLALLNR